MFRFLPQEAKARSFEDDKSCYENVCIICKLSFFGYKRRFVCRKCER